MGPAMRALHLSFPGYAALIALLLGIAMMTGWGFTVDDALISARVAHHLATGHGYRFNALGDVVDAVTPLGWAGLLSPFAQSGVLQTWRAARWLGVLGAVLCAGFVARYSYGPHPERRVLALLPTALCLPLGAWCVSGMETPLVLLLATLALTPGEGFALWAGAAAALRPELIPWALTLVLLRPAASPARRLGRLLLVLTPVALVIGGRVLLFSTPTPLAAVAKPSDLSHGLRYALSGLLWVGLTPLFISCRGLARLSGQRRAEAVALVAHVLALAAAGGDWMSLFRLFVPVLGHALVLVACINAQSPPRWTALRASLAAALCLMLQRSHGASARHVLEQRTALIATATPILRDARRIATLDVGWVGAATDATVIDLAGVTDPRIAYLPGGHTSKQLPSNFLHMYQVDTLVVLLAKGQSLDGPPGERAARVVEERLLALPGAESFAPRAELDLKGTEQHYVILQRTAAALERSAADRRLFALASR